MIHLLGTDMISGTPVIDIKPFIPQYDSPWNAGTSLSGMEDMSVNHRNEQHGAHDSTAGESVVLTLPNVEVNSCDNTGAENLSSAITSYQKSDISVNTAKSEVSVAEWITNSVQPTLSVLFTGRAEDQLKQFDSTSPDAYYKLRHLSNASELRLALTAVLQADPRSVYRRKHCQDQLYYVTVDIAHVSCWFDGDTVEVLKVQSIFILHKEHEHQHT